jgi:hypothetical protein
MARTFVAASSQYLESTSTPSVTAVPLTMACWVRIASSSVLSLSAIENRSLSDDNFRMYTNGLTINAAQGASAVSQVSTTAGSLVIGTWAHAAGVFTSNSSRTAYVNGVAGAANSVAIGAPSGINSMSVGRLYHGASPLQYMDGDLAEIAIWNIALSAAELATLALGVSPLLVRPEALVFYAPLLGGSPENDVMRRKSLTVTGATAATTHPRMLLASSKPRMRYGTPLRPRGRMFQVF